MKEEGQGGARKAAKKAPRLPTKQAKSPQSSSPKRTSVAASAAAKVTDSVGASLPGEKVRVHSKSQLHKAGEKDDKPLVSRIVKRDKVEKEQKKALKRIDSPKGVNVNQVKMSSSKNQVKMSSSKNQLKTEKQTSPKRSRKTMEKADEPKQNVDSTSADNSSCSDDGERESSSVSGSDDDEDSEEEEEDDDDDDDDERGRKTRKGWVSKKTKKALKQWFASYFPFVLLAILLVRSVSRRRYDGDLLRSEILRYAGDNIILSNHTLLFPNGTLRFWNGTLRFPNGTLLQRDQLKYEDTAECSASRMSAQVRKAFESYLEQRPGLLGEDEYLEREQGGAVEKYCGFDSAQTFRSWSGMSSGSKIPLLFPQTEEQVVDFVRRIGDAGCKLRPVGAMHSESGLVFLQDDRVVAISLAKFRFSNRSRWSLFNHDLVSRSLPNLLGGQGDGDGDGGYSDNPSQVPRGRIRAEAGLTLLEVHSVSRPRGWFLPTTPRNWAASVGAAATGMVHGGAFGKSFLSTYASRLRVVLGSGQIIEISEPLDLAMWRNSHGLIGLVIGVELQLEPRTFFSMGVRQTTIHHWSPWYLDSAISRLLPGAAGAQYLLDPWTDELAAVGYVSKRPRLGGVLGGALGRSSSGGGGGPAGSTGGAGKPFSSDDDCTFDLQKMACSYPEFCKYRFKLGDILPAQSCRVRRQADPTLDIINASYADLAPVMAFAAQHGLPASEHGSIQRWWEESGAREPKSQGPGDASKWADGFRQAVHHARERLNDGFWMIGASKSVSLCYFFSLPKLFTALDVLRTYIRELVIKNAPFQFRDSPVHFAFVRMEKKQVLIPKGSHSGDWVSIEVRVDTARAGKSSAWRLALAELETRWQQALPEPGSMFPNLGCVHGFHVFRTARTSREEKLISNYRRVKRVREAFARIKQYYESQFSDRPPPRRLFSLFSSRHDHISFEEATGLVDPSEEMALRLEEELSFPMSDDEFERLRQLHENAAAKTESEEEYFGDLVHELLREAYLLSPSEKSAPDGPRRERDTSLPIPFSSPRIMRDMFTPEQQLAFLRYRQRMDPENRFWSGLVTRYFTKRVKRQVSGLDDPDLLEEDQLVIWIKEIAEWQRGEQGKGKATVITVIILAISVFGIVRLCAGLRKKKRRKSKRSRRRRSSSSSEGSSSDESESETSETSSFSSRSSSSSSSSI